MILLQFGRFQITVVQGADVLLVQWLCMSVAGVAGAVVDLGLRSLPSESLTTASSAEEGLALLCLRGLRDATAIRLARSLPRLHLARGQVALA